MSCIYNSYLTGEERYLAIAESTEDLLFEKLFTAYEMAGMQSNILAKEAELKVFTESGTYDDLEYLLEEANKEGEEKQKGILRTIWDAIIGIFTSISNKIKDFFAKHRKNENLEEQFEMNSNDKQTYDGIFKFWKNIQQGFEMIKNKDRNGGLKTLSKGIIVGIAEIGAGAAVATTIVKISKSEKDGMIEKIQDVASQAIAKANEVKSNVIAGAVNFAEAVKKFANLAFNWIQTIFKSAKNKVVGAATSVKDHVDSKIVNPKKGNTGKNKIAVGRIDELFESVEDDLSIFGINMSTERNIQESENADTELDELDALMEDL